MTYKKPIVHLVQFGRDGKVKMDGADVEVDQDQESSCAQYWERRFSRTCEDCQWFRNVNQEIPKGLSTGDKTFLVIIGLLLLWLAWGFWELLDVWYKIGLLQGGGGCLSS